MNSLDYVKNHQSMMDKETIDTLGFSADTNTNKMYHKIRTSRDGSSTIEYRAPLPLGAREMKVAFTLATQCIDDDGKFIAPVNNTMASTRVDLRKMAKFVYGKSTIDKRKNIFDALFRIKGLSLKFTYDEQIAPSMPRRPIITGWLHEAIADSEEYLYVDVVLSSIFLSYILKNPISFNLEKMISYDGRACFMYMTMQGFKYKMKKGNRYAYFDHIPHERLVQGLDLVGHQMKHQKAEIKKAFKIIGLDYLYNKRTENWDKIRGLRK